MTKAQRFLHRLHSPPTVQASPAHPSFSQHRTQTTSHEQSILTKKINARPGVFGCPPRAGFGGHLLEINAQQPFESEA